MNLEILIKYYQTNGYSYPDAVAKLCQDIVLYKISKSKYSKNITVKGGIVMHNISNNIRRATRDIDLDFIRYSLDDSSIINFIDTINSTDNNFNIKIIGNIVPLHHQDYDGKRVFIKILDHNHFSLTTKLDIGVHKQFNIDQDEYCFNLDIINQNANLLINSKEQVFTEKLKSLLKLGIRSTRYKDLFDLYYLINEAHLNNSKLLKCFNILIFSDVSMKENSVEDIYNRIKSILNSIIYRNNLTNINANWLDINVDDVITNILNYFNNFTKIIE